MSKVIVCVNITLDGVMQAPARADEDVRDGFAHGGWGAPYGAMAHAGDAFAGAGALLLGRRTYEDFYRVWPARSDSTHSAWLTNIPKYVASHTLTEPLPWANSTLLTSDLTTAVRALKTQLDERPETQRRNILVLGSGELIHALLRQGLIDEFVLLIHPLVLGSGRRLFSGDDTFAKLTLVESSVTPSGVLVATYRPG